MPVGFPLKFSKVGILLLKIGNKSAIITSGFPPPLFLKLRFISSPEFYYKLFNVSTYFFLNLRTHNFPE